jgi:type 1 glutamine amidotransferase
MTQKRVLLFLGGTWHDFAGFASTMIPVLEVEGYSVESTYNLGMVEDLQGQYDIALIYTCLGGTSQPGKEPALDFTEQQATVLADWVHAGGALLAAHAATASGQNSPVLRALMGGVFIEHPPQFAFNVIPLRQPHPITAGIDQFTVKDEFYIQEYEPDIQVHMIAVDRGQAYPMVWSRVEGKGRVAHIALGHGPEVWNHKPYQKLMIKALAWISTPANI